jgi:hypothetical protein
MGIRDEQFRGHPSDIEHGETFFRLINPEDYARLGIDDQDVPMGTFAAEDHPTFLPSRFGGNAYGLGLVEQSALSRADMDFLENLDFQNALDLGKHAKKLNTIYQKLGLLIRFSLTGKRYFLIPISLVAHSLQEINAKADEIEGLVLHHIRHTETERLDIGLLTGNHDLIVHELTARLSTHRIFLFDSIEKLRSWRLPLDIVIIPKDLVEYLLEQQLPKLAKRSLNRQRLFQYAKYLAGKIHDILEPTGELFLLSHAPGPQEDQFCEVKFKSEEDFKTFLLFTHIFKTEARYEGARPDERMRIHISDLHYYLNRFAFFDPHLKRLLDHQKPGELTIEEANKLPYLNLRMPRSFLNNPEKQWASIFEPYFTLKQLNLKSPGHRQQHWEERLEIDRALPESLMVFAARPRQPVVSLSALEEEVKASGLEGCSLSLVAAYRDSFKFVLDVLKIIVRMRDHDFPQLTELEKTRLTNPFRSRNQSMAAVIRLIGQISKIERCRDVLNPDHIDGEETPLLEHIPKLSLLGFTPAQLRELMLIVVGHTTMSRIVFGKLPAKSLKPITDKAAVVSFQEILDLLRVCRLMSMAEMVAALGESYTVEQARELYRLYDDSIQVATDPKLDWDKLQDLHISALGGVQNKAVREMLKFFSLFDFLGDWHEVVDKGPAMKEVMCDYQPERLQHLDEAAELARIAGHFKQLFMGDYIFGQTYFFRQFLDTEFHGTGHLFPKLGTRAGFILLWITVNSSERNAINFNPVLAGIPQDRHDERIAKIKALLLRIPIERLDPGFFQEIKGNFSEGRPAFVFDTGIRMIRNPETRVVEVSFVDIDENIRQIDALLSLFESQKLRGISLRNLQEMERFFSELESLHHYLQQEGCYIQCDIFTHTGGIELKDREIGEIELRLKKILHGQIFVPEEIYDSISALAKYCPDMLRFVLPEFHALGNLLETWPTRQKQPVGIYSMRCIEKFQALVIKDRNAFQNQNAFYQLAKLEFGPLAEGGIGASHAQMDILEYLVDRIQQWPLLYQALTFALLFQDIGKIDEYAESLPEVRSCRTHAERGALIIEKSEILKKYNLGPQIEQLVILLVRYHGSIGHVLQGEEPVTALEEITSAQDDRLLDVFALHAILAASAVREGLMISDLLDAFLGYRAAGLQIIKSKSSWSAWLRENLREKGEAVLSDFQLTSQETHVLPTEQTHYCGFIDEDIEDDSLWRGRQSAALERLLKLVGAIWVDYHDLQMHLMKMPVNFIYHKKKLKSVGPHTFERQLLLAGRLLKVISDLSSEVRYYLLYCLDHLGAGMRIYGFDPLAELLDPQACVKLLIISFQSFHRHFGPKAVSGLVNFGNLSRGIDRRRDALRNILDQIPFPEQCFSSNEFLSGIASFGSLEFQVDTGQPGISVVFRDSAEFDSTLLSLGGIWDPDELLDNYLRLADELQQTMKNDTAHFQEELRRTYEEQRLKINDRILRSFQNRLGALKSFSELHAMQVEIQESISRVSYSEAQMFHLREMFEFHRARMRDRYLDSVYRHIGALGSRKALSDYWDSLKHELFAYRPYVGKEYELLIAQFIDQELDRIEN